MATFRERIEELIATVGRGDLVGSVEVAQLYAAYQEFRLDLHHPRGGQARYLGEPIMASVGSIYQDVADGLLDGHARDAMIQSMENLSGEVESRAPIELGPLHYSGHPQVVDNGVTVYDRPPIVPWLSQEELNALRRAAEQATD